jgi:hypothetical protein
MTNARTKVVFGGLSKPDAEIMVDEMFAGQINYEEVKFLIEQTKFWPTYRRDKVYTSSKGGASGTSASSGTAKGQHWDPHLEEWLPTTSATSAEGMTESQTWSEGMSDIPLFYPVPFKEVSSKRVYTLEEQKNRLADRLKEQYQRHFFIRRPGHDTIPAVTPFVEDFKVFPQNEEEYILERCIKPHGLYVGEIDRRRAARRRRLLERAHNPPTKDVDAWE